MDFQRVAVIGPGLLGGSLVRAIGSRSKESGVPEVRVWGRRAEPIEQLRSEGDATVASRDLAEVAAGADLIVLATPIGIMGAMIETLIELGAIREGVVVTDVGSVKASVVARLEAPVHEAGARFVGSHPMAGSEKTGLEYASADLFVDAACILTPTPATDAVSLDRVESFWKWLGSRTSRLSPEEHDRSVALISHLPHLVAALLVESVLGRDAGAGEYAGGGFRDTTRIASGAPEMWAEILQENHEAVREALGYFHQLTGESLAFLDEVKKEDLLRLLADAKERRDDLCQREDREPSHES
ncbi:MAG: prephenate dehydrogenase/arogenate dehydrogenase family protein [Verrucomicrobiae bacterium]|nr:prephenate dehydrogenase/arogenate dehydrogenase family protein [Verrucomicrobiae bacterium]